ncbi:MAG TPA: o-succinylbenzoate--CoA ligase [Chloroflexota bacterium]|nr:o-succinylbenzoate--CoA ligase [Chloroflexota bacterium]
MTWLPDWLAQRAVVAGTRPALLHGDRCWTFAELNAEVDELAARLRQAGVQRGERLGLLLGSDPTFVAAVHAAPRLGATLVPLNPRLTPGELAWQLAHAKVGWLLHDAEHAPLAQAAAERQLQSTELHQVTPSGTAAQQPTQAGVRLLAAGDLRLSDMPGPHAEAEPAPLIDLEETHSIVFTSGTTGRPKGALLSYGNHWWSAIGAALNVGLSTSDRLLACLPLYHVGGLSTLFRGAIYGCTVILQSGFDPRAVNAAIDEQGATAISVVAVTLRRLLDERGARPFPATLRCVLAGGGPIPRALLEECAARELPVLQTYGLTESAAQAVTLSPEDALRKLGSAGHPLPQVQLRIVAGERDADVDEAGEIFLRGPSIMRGYLGEPPLPDGWLATGDIGWLDAEGYLYVGDRRDDLIISGGENVYPAEVEAALLAHPCVVEAGVVGLPDERWGQVPAALAVLRDGSPVVDAAELVAFCRERLASYKVPTSISFAAALPRTSSGKLMRHQLRTTLAEGVTGAP